MSKLDGPMPEKAEQLTSELTDVLISISAVKGPCYAEAVRLMFSASNQHLIYENIISVLSQDRSPEAQASFIPILEHGQQQLTELFFWVSSVLMEAPADATTDELYALQIKKSKELEADMLMLAKKQMEYGQEVLAL